MITSLPAALDARVADSPAYEAVRSSGRSLTYSQLQQQANRLAATLQANGVSCGDRVGLYMNKDIESVVALYGIMKAGAAYVPLDPFAPVERLSFVIEDCGIGVLITNEKKRLQVGQIVAATNLETLVGLAPEEALSVTCIPWQDAIDGLAGDEPTNRVMSQDLAYILYTSGSTGTPKGIMHTHHSALSFAQWATTTYGLTSADCVSNHAPLHFDLSTFDLYATVLAGGTTVIIPEMLTRFPTRLAELIEKEQISIWYSVPFALIQLLEKGGLAERDLAHLRWVLFAGESFPTKHLRRLMMALPHPRYSNLYGPTETNVCTYYHVDQIPITDEPIPIGKPCANVKALMLNANDQPVLTDKTSLSMNDESAEGAVGELVISGEVVMHGYWGQPELNERSFYSLPMFENMAAGGVTERFYRTGDLVQIRSDGNYAYLGRKDRQVKTRGYRVELDAIEVVLLTHQEIQEAAVYTMTDEQGTTLIAAAVTAKPGSVLDQRQLTQYLLSKLPPYAIPTTLALLDTFPRTSTGKINRRLLQGENAA
ncbi:MAG: amino acid adenylation domain-containing protein [Chloroflexota bacterium]